MSKDSWQIVGLLSVMVFLIVVMAYLWGGVRAVQRFQADNCFIHPNGYMMCVYGDSNETTSETSISIDRCQSIGSGGLVSTSNELCKDDLWQQ